MPAWESDRDSVHAKINKAVAMVEMWCAESSVRSKKRPKSDD